jgi:GT2 family glycosyltransferase
MPGFSVVICAYTQDRWRELAAAVAAVRTQTQAACELIIVIDHNHSLWERACQNFSDVTVIENTDSRGLSGARNTGIRAAQSELVAFMDEDAVAEPDWLEQLGRGYDNAQVLGVGGAIEPIWSNGQPRWFPNEFKWVVGCSYRGMPVESAPVRNLIGCNMSFRREVLLSLGGFRDGIGRIGTLPVGCEETELCIRAHRRWPQGIIRYQPEARVFHHVPAQRATWRYFRSRCFHEGRSKAVVAALAGKRAGLATERAYTLQTLPQGYYRGVRDTMLRGDPAGLARSAAIVAGLMITTAGYVSGLAQAKAKNRGRHMAADQAGGKPRGQATFDGHRQ